MSDILLHNLSEIATPLGSTPRCGAEQGRISRRRDEIVLCRQGRIEFIGSEEELPARLGDTVERFDGGGGTLVPGFVDPHTHLPWAGDRAAEFAERLAGKTYMEIAAAGGGILSTVRATRGATRSDLAAAVTRRLDTMLVWGTTTAEAKSGYGLTVADEIKQLEAIAAATASHPVDLVPTLLAGHEVPPEHRDDRQQYVDLVCEEIIPAVAEADLARFSDVFCERGVFSADDARRMLTVGRDHGLLPRLHADEFEDSGGAELAAELGALSADHLVAVSERGIEALAAAGITAVLLPATSFFLMKHRYAPARRFIEHGIPVALATDCNPGSSHTESLVMSLTLAVFEMGMSVGEALTAATLNASCSLGLGSELGSIEVGKHADLVLLDAPSLEHLAYHFGINPVTAVFKRGRLVHRSAPPPSRLPLS